MERNRLKKGEKYDDDNDDNVCNDDTVNDDDDGDMLVTYLFHQRFQDVDANKKNYHTDYSKLKINTLKW